MAVAAIPRRRADPVHRWRARQIVAFGLCWAAGIALCVIAVAILGLMVYKGAQFLRPALIFARPQAGFDQSQIGGFLDPLAGTALLTVIAIVIATPVAVTTALWVVEYGRPAWLARVVESAVEVVAGTPDIVIAIFGLAIFQLHLLAPLSFTASGGGVFGRSFFAAGAMLSLIAVPLIYGSTREGLLAVPARLREASWALGKTRICTVRTILLPQVRRNVATGATLAMGRIVGDTAVVVILLGASLQLGPQGNVPGLNVLRGTGSTLTTYVYDTSPAGLGNAPQKAYAAAALLLVVVLALQGVASLIGDARPEGEVAGGSSPRGLVPPPPPRAGP